MPSRHNVKKAPAVRHKAVADWSEPPPLPKDPRGVVVRVLKEGVYANPRHKALPPAAPGDLIEVAAGPYADSLIADGFVVLPGAAPVEEPAEEPAEE